MNTQHQNQESLMDLIQEAVIRKGKSRDIDVGKEWEKVCKKANVQTERKQPPQHSFIWGAITGIAATILAIFVFTYVDLQSGDTYTLLTQGHWAASPSQQMKERLLTSGKALSSMRCLELT